MSQVKIDFPNKYFLNPVANCPCCMIFNIPYKRVVKDDMVTWRYHCKYCDQEYKLETER